VPRLFVAAEIYRKNEIQKIQQNLISYLNLEYKYLKPVRPENFHFTLVFFGEVNKSILDQLVAKISEIDFESFEINYGVIGAFPNNKNAKVVWIGLDDATKPVFDQMSQNVTSKLKELDLKLEKEIKKEMIPHITLFRTKKASLNLNLNDIKSNFTLSDRIDTISVKKSMTTPQGPIYENIISVRGK
jgi:RNA 2',3'-cyclic 3'-phosphodiesterase